MDCSEMTIAQLGAAWKRALRAGDLPVADDLVAELRWRHEWARACDGAIRAAWGERSGRFDRERIARNTAVVRAAVAAARGRAA